MTPRTSVVILTLVLSSIVALVPNFAIAQELKEAADDEPMTAVITGPHDIAIGRTVILDASASHISGERVQYIWTIEETKRIVSRSVEAIYTPEKTGKLTFLLTVKSVDLSGQIHEVTTRHVITAFRHKVAIIADTSAKDETLQKLTNDGMKSGVLVQVIKAEKSFSLLSIDNPIFALLSEQKQSFSNVDSIVIWTKGITGLQAFMRFIDGDPQRSEAMHNQTIVLITSGNLSTLIRTARGAFSLLQPSQIIVTRESAVQALLNSDSTTNFRSSLLEKNIDFQILNAASVRLKPWDILSMLVNYLLSHGVSGQTVILLLMLPVIATIFAFLKQVIGITSFGLYTPSIVTLSFLALGWWVGLLFLLFILITGYTTRTLMRRFRMLYIPKVAIILTVVSLTLLVLVGFGTRFGLVFSRETVFILLTLSTLTENFLNLKAEEGWHAALLGITETIIGSLLCVFIVQWQWFQSSVLAYPELVLLTIIINIFLGRWTGLRLVEYFRFREVFRHLQAEE